MIYFFKKLKTNSILYLFVLSFITTNTFGQVGIGTTNPKATLDISGHPSLTNVLDGIIVPRLTGDQLQLKTYTSDQTGAMIYVSAPVTLHTSPEQVTNIVSKGYYYFDGIDWINMNSGSTSYWGINGNNTTNAVSNFIGTTNEVDFITRTNNIERIRISSTGNIGIGTANPTAQLHTTGTIRFSGAGTPGTNKILVSDNDGNATWETAASLINSNALAYNTGTGALTSTINGVASNTINITQTPQDLRLVGTQSHITSDAGVGSNGTSTGADDVIAIGAFAGNANSGTTNIFLGSHAGRFNTTGTPNIAIGFKALYANTTGNNNFAIGYQALDANTTGHGNLAIGKNTLGSNTTGGYNLAIGIDSLTSNTSGLWNTSIGYLALKNNVTGSNNIALGQSSLYYNSIGDVNIGVGSRALFYNTSGSNNIAIGSQALENNILGTENIAIGNDCLFNNTASGQTATGYQALYYNTTGSANTAFGYKSLYSNTTANSNSAFGNNSLYNNTTGANNTAIGVNSLYSNDTASHNTAIGSQSLFLNTTGIQNTAIGRQSLNSNNANGNTAVGFQSLYLNAAGTYNTAIGNGALAGNTNGYDNIAIGYNASSTSTTGSNNIVIGVNAAPSSSTISNQVTIGNSSNNAYRMFAASWTNASDKRLKHNIKPLSQGLNFIKNLKPVEYIYNNSNDKKKTLGFIAQDVKQTMQENGMDDNYNLVNNLDHKYLGLNTTEIIPILTKAMQEQQELLTKMEERLQKLELEYIYLSKENELLKKQSSLSKVKDQLPSDH